MNPIHVPEDRLESPPAQRTDLDAYHYWERPYKDDIINLPIQISQAVDQTHCASQGQGRLTKHFNESLGAWLKRLDPVIHKSSNLLMLNRILASQGLPSI